MKGIMAITGLIGVLSGTAYASIDYEQAEQMLQAGQAGKALKQIESSIKAGITVQEEKRQWLFLKARALSAAGKTRQAVSAYRDLIKEDADFTEAYNNLAVIYARQGDMEKASKVLEQALTQTDPVFATVYENLQSVYVEMTRDSYGKALRLNVKPHKLTLKDVSLAIAGQKKRPAELNYAQAGAGSKSGIKTERTGRNLDPVTEANSAADDAYEEVKTTLLGWASAWSAQEIDLYLSFYAKTFRPPGGMGRRSWEKQRRYRLRRPKWVKVTLSDISVERAAGKQARVLLMQEYRSDIYTGKSRKQFILQNTTEGWRILSEKSL